MCIKFPKPAEPVPQKAPPPITPRVEKDTSVKSNVKELVDKDEAKQVQFGARKEATAGAGSKVSTDALRIKLNPGATGGTTGGLNTP